MKIGYPCINRSIECTSNATFRLSSYSTERLIATVEQNLHCLEQILLYNLEHNFLFFRISSAIVPFASHPVCTFDWVKHFAAELDRIGAFIKKHHMRISMHPDQFVVINSPREDVVKRSLAEIQYHGDLLDALNLGPSSKIQIHVGGVYNNKDEAMQRFIHAYKNLPCQIKKRLVIENDDRSYSFSDCLSISNRTHIPVLFDVFHHQCHNRGETIMEAFLSAQKTWKKRDGTLMVDYSNQQRGAVKGKHAETIDANQFREFVHQTRAYDYDCMLEIKDKEKSAEKALAIVRKERFGGGKDV